MKKVFTSWYFWVGLSLVAVAAFFYYKQTKVSTDTGAKTTPTATPDAQ